MEKTTKCTQLKYGTLHYISMLVIEQQEVFYLIDTIARNYN